VQKAVRQTQSERQTETKSETES